MLIDYHVHPNYSIDADPEASVVRYCHHALEIGLEEMCFTTHYDSDPERKKIDAFIRVRGEIWPLDSAWTDHYLADVEEAKAHYAGNGLKISAGIEVDYIAEVEEEIGQFLARREFDFVMGSVHCLDHIAISSSKECRRFFQGKSARTVCELYYREMEKALRSGLFDAIGHLDVYRRYGRAFYGEEIERAHEGLVEPILDLMAHLGVALEINTACLRRPEPLGFSPSEELLRLARQHGVSQVTIGSDCHCVADLGQGVGRALSLANSLGFRLLRLGEKEENKHGPDYRDKPDG